jgi:hypothetical protein
VTTHLARFEHLIRFVRELGGTWELRIRLRETESLAKAQFLRDDGRDFFSVTPQMQARVMAALKRELAQALRGGRTPRDYLAVAAEAAKEHILWRFETGGGEMNPRPLSARYLAYKRRHVWLRERVGWAYGTLYRDVKLATFEIVKTS